MKTLGKTPHKKSSILTIDFTKKPKSDFISSLKDSTNKKVMIVDYIYLLSNPSYNTQSHESLYLIKDHINLSGGNPLIGPQFIAMNDLYDLNPTAYDLSELTISHKWKVINPLVIAGLKDGVIPNMYEIKQLIKVGVKAYCYNLVHAAIFAKSLNIKVIGIGITSK